MPFFAGRNEAERYAKFRPNFHPLAIKRAIKATGLNTMTPIALDVACGTGQSTYALTSVADRVIGLDISWNMLASAWRKDGIRYLQARAEAIPLRSASLPLVSTALAFHWFDRAAFLQEVGRILRPHGLLFLYTNGFTGKMNENPAFLEWSAGVYPARFPAPPRESRPITQEEASDSGFEFIKKERYENDVRYSPEELIAYLATQTNIMAAVNQGRESIESAYGWLLDQVQPYFTGPKDTFVFVTRAWYLRKK